MDSPRFKVTVPATTANLGAGLDCLGLALTLYNEIEVTPSDAPFLAVKGEGAEESSSRKNLILRTFESFFLQLREKPPSVGIICTNHIPFMQGLGSSAAARIGALVAANQCLGNRLSLMELIQVAARDEGHPDNVAAALLGGLVVCGGSGTDLVVKKIQPTPGLRVVLLIPKQPLKTQEARLLLPDTVPITDAIINLQNTALTVTAFTTGDYPLLNLSLSDRLHQPYREPLMPGFRAVVESARKAGAFGAALSGAGTAIAAFVSDHEQDVAAAMEAAFRKNGNGSCRTLILDVDHDGTRVSIF